MQAQKSRETKVMIIQLNGRLDSRKTFKDKDPLKMTSWQIFIFSEDDIMAGYKSFYKQKRMDFV